MLTDTEGGEGLGGAIVSGLHTLHVAGNLPLAMPQVIAPLPTDEVVSLEGGHTISQLTSTQHLGGREVEVM